MSVILLVKKINKKIEKTSFADIMKAKEERVMDGRMEKNEYTDMVKSSYQQDMRSDSPIPETG